MTPQEKKLWDGYLHYCPWKFRRQMALDRFVLDFCCIPLRLVIEVDGSQHETAAGRIRDQERSAYLRVHGYTVIRFSNTQIDTDMENVILRIEETCKARTASYGKTDKYAYRDAGRDNAEG